MIRLTKRGERGEGDRLIGDRKGEEDRKKGKEGLKEGREREIYRKKDREKWEGEGKKGGVDGMVNIWKEKNLIKKRVKEREERGKMQN